MGTFDSITFTATDGTTQVVRILINGAKEPIYHNGSMSGENMIGSVEQDHMFGFGGADNLKGHGGDDMLSGGYDDDNLNGGAGADTIDGGAGVDHATYFKSSEGVRVDLANGFGLGGEAQGDVLMSIENVTGSRAHDDRLVGSNDANVLKGKGGDDTLDGGDGDDALFGEIGDDLLTGGRRADVIHGGTGVDSTSYFQSAEGVRVDLSTGIGSGGDAMGDVLTSIEDVTGSRNFDDHLTGTDGVNVIKGRGGDDTINGLGGDDILHGGGGDDVFIFNTDWGNDRVTGFDVGGGDMLDFSALAIGMEDLEILYQGRDTAIAYGGNEILILNSSDVLTIDEFQF